MTIAVAVVAGVGPAHAANAVPCPSGEKFQCVASLQDVGPLTHQTQSEVEAVRRCMAGRCPSGYELVGNTQIAVAATVEDEATDPRYEIDGGVVYGCSSAGQSASFAGGTIHGSGFRLGLFGALGLFELIGEQLSGFLRTVALGLLPIIEFRPPEPPEEVELEGWTSRVAWGHKKRIGTRALLYRVHAEWLVVEVQQNRSRAYKVAVPDMTADYVMTDADGKPRTRPIDEDNVMTHQEGIDQCGWTP
jgi:hypothetical protein